MASEFRCARNWRGWCARRASWRSPTRQKFIFSRWKRAIPLHFAWRVYLPPNHPQEFAIGKQGMSASSSGGASSMEMNFILRLRVREADDQGRIGIYLKWEKSSLGSSVGGPTLSGFMRGRWRELEVSQAGVDGVVVIDPKESVELLRLSMPKTMQEEAISKQLSVSADDRYFIPTILECWLGSKPFSKPATPASPNP